MAPVADRLTAPLARAFLRRNNSVALHRPAEELAELGRGERNVR